MLRSGTHGEQCATSKKKKSYILTVELLHMTGKKSHINSSADKK